MMTPAYMLGFNAALYNQLVTANPYDSVLESTLWLEWYEGYNEVYFALHGWACYEAEKCIGVMDMSLIEAALRVEKQND